MRYQTINRIHTDSNIELGHIVCSNPLLSGPRHFENMSMPSMYSNPYVLPPVAKPDVPTPSDVPDCNPFPLDTMVRVDVKKEHECLRYVQDFFFGGYLLPTFSFLLQLFLMPCSHQRILFQNPAENIVTPRGLPIHTAMFTSPLVRSFM